jgi:hypothetical protein
MMQTKRHKRKKKKRMLALCDEDLKEKNIATYMKPIEVFLEDGFDLNLSSNS